MGRLQHHLLAIVGISLAGCYEGIPEERASGLGGIATLGDDDAEGGSDADNADDDAAEGESDGDDGNDGDGNGDGDAGGDGDGDGDGDSGGDGDGDSSTSSGSGASTGDSGGDGDGDGDGDGAAVDPEDGVYARDISLTDITINQAVEVPLATTSGTTTVASRNARIIKGRDALIRAQWQTQSGFTPRTLEGRLVIEPPGGSPQIYTHQFAVNGSPNPASYSGTFRWAVDGADIQPGSRYSVALFELGTTNSNTPAPSVAPRMPASGTDDMGVDAGNYELDVVLVPIAWTYGGQTRTTSLSSADIETVRSTIYNQNPVSAVNVSVRSSPVAYSGSPDLSGILTAVSSARSSDNVPTSYYYEGVVDFGCFAVYNGQCSNSGGTTGLGYVATLDSWAVNQRASISVWYQAASSAETINHELGHNQGLNHVGCGGASGADPNYPYSGGAIGVRGHELGTTNIISSSGAYDYMGYCSPNWVSDWTFEKTADRAGVLTTSVDQPEQPLGWVLQGIINAEGIEHWAIVRGWVPVEERDDNVRVRLINNDQIEVEVAAYDAELPDNGGRVIVMELPDEVTSATELGRFDRVELVDYGALYDLSVDLPGLATTLALD